MQITGAACLGNLLVGIGKLMMGIISLSFFTCVSAFYTFGMVLAKACVLCTQPASYGTLWPAVTVNTPA